MSMAFGFVLTGSTLTGCLGSEGGGGRARARVNMCKTVEAVGGRWMRRQGDNAQSRGNMMGKKENPRSRGNGAEKEGRVAFPVLRHGVFLCYRVTKGTHIKPRLRASPTTVNVD
jgi:hypothetical protein